MTASLSPEQKALEVIQADRDEAADYMAEVSAMMGGYDPVAMAFMDAACDSLPIVQAFARHRISSRTIAIEEARRAVWDAVAPLLKDLPPHRARDGSCYVTAANAAETAIRSLKDQSV